MYLIYLFQKRLFYFYDKNSIATEYLFIHTTSFFTLFFWKTIEWSVLIYPFCVSFKVGIWFIKNSYQVTLSNATRCLASWNENNHSNSNSEHSTTSKLMMVSRLAAPARYHVEPIHRFRIVRCLSQSNCGPIKHLISEWGGWPHQYST